MASKTPNTVTEHSVGSNNLIVATFSTNDWDNADTWDSYIPSVVGYWTNATDDPTQGKEKVDVAHSQNRYGTDNSSRFTFYTGEDNRTGILYVLAKK